MPAKYARGNCSPATFFHPLSSHPDPPQHGGSSGTALHPPRGHPNTLSSFYWLLTSSWLNLLLIFVPLGFVAEKLHWAPVWVFSLNFLAIMPLAKVSRSRVRSRPAFVGTR